MQQRARTLDQSTKNLIPNPCCALSAPFKKMAIARRSAVSGLCVADGDGVLPRIFVHLADPLPEFSEEDLFPLNFENGLPERRVYLLETGEELFEGLRFR